MPKKKCANHLWVSFTDPETGKTTVYCGQCGARG
jgi:hypothetical protein